MNKLLNHLVFRDRLPWDYRLIWPSTLDEPILIVLVKWNEGDPFDEYRLRISLDDA